MTCPIKLQLAPLIIYLLKCIVKTDTSEGAAASILRNVRCTLYAIIKKGLPNCCLNSSPVVLYKNVYELTIP